MDDEDYDFSDDDVEGSDLGDPGQTEDTPSLDSESGSGEEQWDITRVDLEHSITHLWDATQDMTNIDDARFILPHEAKFETVDLTLVRDLPTGRVDGNDPRCQYPSPGVFDERQCGSWMFGELSTRRLSRISDE
jgi:hypothetical protein